MRALGRTVQPLDPDIPNRFTTNAKEWVAV